MGVMHDSGSRQAFDTGSVRDTADGKPRIDLISPFALQRLGEWLRLGAIKYSEHNWAKGQPYSRVTASMCRHVVAWMAGEWDEDHLAAVMCNAMFLMHYQHQIEADALPAALDDMPTYRIESPPHVDKCMESYTQQEAE